VRNTKVKDLLKPGKNVIAFKYNDPLSHVSKVLSENNILSAPILKGGNPMGFLDTLDMCQYLVHCWRQHRDAATGEVHKENLPEKFSSAVAQRFINSCGRNAYHFIYEDSTLEECLNTMVHDEFSFHRLAVHSRDNKIVGIISQTDIMQFAGRHLDILPEGNKSLRELGLVKGVVMVRMDGILGDTLEILAECKISGLALVDNEGKLVANFSASDLRGLPRAVFSWLSKPTIDFLQHFGRGVKPPIAESSDTTFRNIAEKLAHLSKERIHRVYLIDKDEHPVGVVSLSDIMPLLQPHETSAQEAH